MHLNYLPFTNASSIGNKKPATSPPAKPLLYKFTPPCIIPTFVAKRKCNIPAINPILEPYTPAIGAKVVENKTCNKVQAYWCNTLFSRCKVTKQPDHGDIYIYYQLMILPY